jgi:hypothetical protein
MSGYWTKKQMIKSWRWVGVAKFEDWPGRQRCAICRLRFTRGWIARLGPWVWDKLGMPVYLCGGCVRTPYEATFVAAQFTPSMTEWQIKVVKELKQLWDSESSEVVGSTKEQAKDAEVD